MPHSSTQWPAKPRLDAAQLPLHTHALAEPEGAFLPDAQCDGDHVVVIYPHGHCPPEITVQSNAQDVQTVLADGVAVAVVARTTGPDLIPSDVVLVERYAGRQ